MFAAAAFVALLGLIFLFHTIVAVIDIWLPEWAGYLITTGLLFLVAAILALLGRNSMKAMKGKPERTIKNAQDTLERPQVRLLTRLPSRSQPATPRFPRHPAERHTQAMSLDASMALIEGPWEHRFVAANGARFHVAEQGEGPVVLLLHGFPQFWWAWRHQMQALADAGYRACAMDLRGYGASDKPPRGYDTRTSATDVASVLRSLGRLTRGRRRPRAGAAGSRGACRPCSPP